MLIAAASLIAVGIRAQTTVADLTDALGRRQSQVELLEAQVAQQKGSVDVLADGLEVAVFICDAKANILYANRRAWEMFRFEEPLGRSVLAVTLSYDLERLIVEAHRTEEPQNAELNFTYPEDRVGLAKAWTQPQSDRVFLSVYEITDLRRLERVRQDFVSNVSHEIRTPLTIIRAMAETLLDEPKSTDETQTKYLEKVVSEVDRLSLITNDLLILSAAESNPVRKHACNIAEVFSGVVESLRPRATDKSLTIEYHGPAEAVIEANAAQMTQVAINLVENAINYAAEGAIEVDLETGTDSIAVRVADHGIGIASEHLPRIFERFYRVDKGRSRSSGGTGLGLSIVKHIVEAHGGRVTVESSLHKGATFTVTLPVGETSWAAPV